MEKSELEIGDVVQIDPQADPVFGGALMMVTEPKSWGAQGFVHGLDRGSAFYRCKFENMEFVGKASWVSKTHLERTEEQ